MKRKSAYRVLLILVLFLTAVYTLGLAGLIPFRVSYYITILMLALFIVLRLDYHRGRH